MWLHICFQMQYRSSNGVMLTYLLCLHVTVYSFLNNCAYESFFFYWSLLKKSAISPMMEAVAVTKTLDINSSFIWLIIWEDVHCEGFNSNIFLPLPLLRSSSLLALITILNLLVAHLAAEPLCLSLSSQSCSSFIVFSQVLPSLCKTSFVTSCFLSTWAYPSCKNVLFSLMFRTFIGIL